MQDNLTPEQRSYSMSRVKGKTRHWNALFVLNYSAVVIDLESI